MTSGLDLIDSKRGIGYYGIVTKCPTITATYGVKGQLALYIHKNNTPNVYQKQDNGITTNWKEVGGSAISISSLGMGACVDDSGVLKDAITAAKAIAVTTIFTSLITADLQTTLDNASDGDVIEVQTNAVYGAVIIPSNKALILRSGEGFLPVFTAAQAMTLKNGTRDFYLIGFKFFNCLTNSSNIRGGAMAFEAQGTKVSNIYISNCEFEKSTGSAVLFAYNQTSYVANYTNEMQSQNINFVDCKFLRAGTDPTEGAQIHIRGVNGLTIRRCTFNAGDGTDPGWPGEGIVRGTNLHACTEFVIEDSSAINSSGGNGEGFKFDMLSAATAPFKNQGTIQRCYNENCREGIDIDDQSNINVIGNFVFQCEEGITAGKITSEGTIIGNKAIECDEGIELKSSVLDDNFILSCNLSINSSVANYNIENGLILDTTNLQGTRASLLLLLLGGAGPFTPSIPADWAAPQPKTINDALNRLSSAVAGLLAAPIP